VIHPNQLRVCTVAFTPSPSEVATSVAMLRAAMDADVLRHGATTFQGEMVDPPMFWRGIQLLLKAHSLRVLGAGELSYLNEILAKLPADEIEDNWPYGLPELH
jgi:hypothetical protein